MELIDKIDAWGQKHWKLVTITCLAAIIIGAALTGGIE